jgi:2-octaprenylphenol hydroxylase
MSRDFDIVIVGAGVVGSVMASLALARKLCKPGRIAILADRIAPPPSAAGAADWDLRVFALSRASQRLLELAAIWQRLPPGRVHPYERMCVWEGEGAPQAQDSLTFDCAELGEPNLGFIVEGRALQEHCQHAAVAAGAVLIESTVQALEVRDTEVRLRLTDGRDLAGRLLIAADGAQSATRALLGIETAGHAYDQDALVAHVRTSKPHRDTAWQRFLRSGPLAFLPLPDGRSSIVWSVARSEAEHLRALDPEAFARALHQASGDVLGGVELTTPVAGFPLKLQYALDYVRPRAVLLGDAAHAVHPLAGQGMNLGLLDCAALVEVLGTAAEPQLLGDHRLLRRYERWRKSENLLAATAFDGLERLFANGNPALARLRVAGLGAVGRLPLLKRGLARRALGLAGDLPAFLKDGRVWPHK